MLLLQVFPNAKHFFQTDFKKFLNFLSLKKKIKKINLLNFYLKKPMKPSKNHPTIPQNLMPGINLSLNKSNIPLSMTIT
jgi:hypothetical protein